MKVLIFMNGKKEKCDALVRAESRRVDFKEGMNIGIDKTIISMLENGIEIEKIAKITNKSIDEINDIFKQKKDLEN